MKHLLLLSTTALLITACTTSDWAPDGYKWDKRTPISEAKPTAGWNKKIEGQDVDKAKNLQAVISGVSADMADTLEVTVSRATPLYVAPRKTINGLTSLYDHALRTKLIDRGFTLASSPTESYSFVYDITGTKQKDAAPYTYDFTLWDVTGEEPALLETRTQQLPESELLSRNWSLGFMNGLGGVQSNEDKVLLND